MIDRLRRVLTTARYEATWQQWLLLVIALVAAVLMRHTLAPNFTPDFSGAMGPWIEYLRVHGFHGLADNFANYNPPFLYLLLLGTILPIHYDLTIVKLISDTFDLLLAAGVAGIALRLRGKLFPAVVAGLATLFVPEVFVNSSLWGQVDGTYTTFLVWAFFFMLGRRDIPAWCMFALAFAFKLQAFFFLPVMAIAFIVQKHRWRAVGAGVIVFLLTYVPALVAGRSISSLASIYVDQTSTQPVLAAFVANMYQWIPQSYFRTVYPAGLLFGVGVVAILCSMYLRRAKALGEANPGVWLIQVAAAIGVVVPFVLPEMHDRYFYAGDVIAMICVLIDRRYLVPALTLQFTAFGAYSMYLFGTPLLPFPVLAAIQLIAVTWVVALSLTRVHVTVSPFFPRVTVIDDADMSPNSKATGPSRPYEAPQRLG